ncbi:MAG: Imidazole glycerol phosphate synthase subunit HisH 1 [Alphaproteobacteria bacterium MarineAlpha4_Bin2]|nr:MAG: Imidazole glycerol phosphate synthase subunit HisH 1 [Alphaproteobacteria bacterium MarineAlpha4_Bin2]
MTVTIVDYGSGNLRSAAKAFDKFASEPVVVTADPDAVARADRIVLPGQGAFADCYRGLSGVDNMIEALSQAVLRRAVPFFGICVGMQLLATAGREHGHHSGLDWIAGEVTPLAIDDEALKVPHMGWNELILRRKHPVLSGIESGEHVYFVHSYHFVAECPDDLIATTDYGGEQTAIVGRDNIIGAQFHPEKSQVTGLRMIENFLGWRP